MKFTKTILAAVLAAVLALVPVAQAQDAGKIYVPTTNSVALNGASTTNCAVLVASTNVYAPFDVSEHEVVGFEVTTKSMAASTSTIQLMGFKSGGLNYETAPSYYQLVTNNGTTAVTTFVPLSVVGASGFRLQIGNTNPTVALTNIAALVRYKNDTVRPRE